MKANITTIVRGKDGFLSQRGFLAMAALMVLMLAAVATILSASKLTTLFATGNDYQKSTAALQNAKTTLLDHIALGRNATEDTLMDAIGGRLPCPDLDGGGSSIENCGDPGISAIGLFPWNTLESPNFRDDANECLWLVVDGSFKFNISTPATNADTNGRFTIVQPFKDAQGNWRERILAGGTTATSAPDRVVAVIIAPGAARSGQHRAPIGNGTQTCALSGADAANSASNYLDRYTSATLTTDNFTMPAANAQKTFVTSDEGQELLNDRLIWITAEEYGRVASKRALRVVATAINNFVYGNGLNGSNVSGGDTLLANGYYPRPAATPGGPCSTNLTRGFVPRTCPSPFRADMNFDIGNRMSQTGDNDPEQWLQQIHYAVSPNCVNQPSNAPSATPINPCSGNNNSAWIRVDGDTTNAHALLLIRGRDTAAACPDSARLSTCINGSTTDLPSNKLNVAATSSDPVMPIYLKPPTGDRNAMYVFRNR